MPITEVITCSECKRKLQVPESYLGQKVQCPECGHQFLAESHPEAVKTTPPAPAAAAPAAPSTDNSRRRRRYEDDDEDDNDSFTDLRPIRHSGVPHRGGMILAIGIIAWVLFPYTTWICGPIAWIMGNSDLARIRAGEMDPGGEGMVQAGRILGMVGTIVILVVAALLGCFIGAVIIGDH